MHDHEWAENLAVVVPPSEEPVTLEEAKLHCRVDIDVDDDLIDGLIVTARQMVESHTRRTLIPTRYELRLSSAPWEGCHHHGWAIELPLPPLMKVNSVKYLDGNGVLQTLGTSSYTVDFGGEGPGTIRGKAGQGFPAVLCGLNAFRVDFVAGYGPYVPLDGTPTGTGTSDDIPRSAKTAIKLIVADLYRNREQSTPENLREIPIGIRNVLSPLRWGYQV